MREWFKYEFGFVNLDTNNLYLTNTGNWHEIEKLNEKSDKTNTKGDNKRNRIIGYLFLVVCLFGFLFFKNILTGRVSISLIILITAGGYKVYQYMKTEIGPKFKIPIEKISDIKIDHKNVQIVFLNGKNIEDCHKISFIEMKGVHILEKLKNNLTNN